MTISNMSDLKKILKSRISGSGFAKINSPKFSFLAMPVSASKFRALAVYLFVSLIVINFDACFYSFSGASVPTHLKTIAIPVFDDRSGQGEPGMREKFTNKLIQKFNDDNTLRVVEKVNANALLECIITSFTDETAVVSAGESIKLRKINISVRAVYKDLVQKKTISEKNYSNYGSYDPSASNVTNLRSAAITDAIDKITDDILLGTVSDW